MRFDHLGIEDGLSSSSVSQVVQDERGFIWFGTQSGLNRYDGYSTTRFENDPFDENSLSHNQIQTIHYDGHGVFWIGTYGGLNRFDPETRRFVHYEHDPNDPTSLSNNVVVAIERDANDALWVGTLDGLNRLDPQTGEFSRYLPDPSSPGALPNKVVRTVVTDHDGNLWVGTYGGLSRYLPDRDAFETVTSDGSHALPSPYVMCVVNDPSDDAILWIGTWDGGVSRFNRRTGAIETYELEFDEIYTMLFDSAGRLWVGTWGGGLVILDPANGAVRRITAQEGDPRSGLSHDVIYSLLEDRSGIMWVGTNGGGVNRYVPWENRFRAHVHRPDDPATIGPGRVETIRIDEDGTAWYGLYNGGLSRYDPATGRFTHYTHDPDDPTSISNNIVNEVFRDSEGHLWVGTNHGLNRYRPEDDSFEQIYAGPDDGSISEDVFFEIQEAPDGDLWMGTHTAGVVVYDPATGHYESFSHDPADPTSLSDDLVRTILHDSRGNTWVGTNHGLNRYDPTTAGFTRYHHDNNDENSISGDNIRAVYEDDRGRIWIATTGGGVNRYDYETDEFTFLSVRDGLASNNVLAVLQDERGSFWFPTDRGISIYDPDTESFRSVDASNGLLSNELTQAAAKGPEGRLYFGSVAGVTVIDADADAYSGWAPPVALTSFAVLGTPRTLRSTGDGSYLPIELEYHGSFFSFEFSALDYSSPSQNSYAYMLEGFDDDWIHNGNRTYASYTNLDPGRYTLRVRGAGSRGNWNNEGVTLPIVVRPPWWRSAPAFVGYAMIAAALIAVAAGAVKRKRAFEKAQLAEQERINAELERKVRERTAQIERSRAIAEHATEEKTRFLANMSHEIRTPLNGMMGMMSLLAKTPLASDQRTYLEYSRVSAENLNTLVDDLLDFERIESGRLRLTAESFSLEDTVRYIEHLFAEGARAKGLNLRVDIALDGAPDRVVADRSRFVQVLANLVSNAVKYTREGGVVLRLDADATATGSDRTEYRIRVEDTGIGMDREDQAHIFDRFVQVDGGYAKSARGVGLGLAIVRQVLDAMGGEIAVDSAPGQGSTFTVKIALPAAHEPLEGTDPGEPASARTNETADVKAPAHIMASGEDSRHQPSGRILVCEDEGINRLYLTRELQGAGYEVETATDGAQAVEKATEGDHALVLMDLGMPQIDGLEATRRIRAWERECGRARIPIIALTAHTYEEDVRKCREAGMDDFVSKPINAERLHAAVRSWLDEGGQPAP
jgi:signal transduction histidine kinase/ligand-binding sensor domain-containing protein/CheY-like chemotaxis protein